MLYKCCLAAQHYLEPDVHMGGDQRYSAWQEAGAGLTIAQLPGDNRATKSPWPCAQVAQALVPALGRVQLSGQCLLEVLAWGASAPWLFGQRVKAAVLARRVSVQLALLPGSFWTVLSDCFCIPIFVLQFCPIAEREWEEGALWSDGNKGTRGGSSVGTCCLKSCMSSASVMASSCAKSLAGLSI